MTAPRVLFAHERPSVRRAVERVLTRDGFDVEVVSDGCEAKRYLERRGWHAFVVDVALPGLPGYELIDLARRPDVGAEVVILVASVYRKTSYKRRPSRLYGADDYVEIHHLCDQLPDKLRGHLGLPRPGEPQLHQVAQAELRAEGDSRLELHEGRRLAQLIVADMILYNGERILAARDLRAASSAVAEDLEIARDLFAQVCKVEHGGVPAGDAIGDAFGELMEALGRTGGVRDG